MMIIRIDLPNRRVVLGDTALSGQWLDFYVVLALARAAEGRTPTFITTDALRRVGPWRYKVATSIGKEVARHLHQLSTKGMNDVLEYRGRTRSWRLRCSLRQVRFIPEIETVQAWLRARTAGVPSDDGWVRSLQNLVDATVALQRGQADTALVTLDAISGDLDAEPALTPWSALVRGRALAQHDDEDDVVLSQLADRWRAPADAAGMAVGARLRALLALRYRFENAPEALVELGKLAAELECRGDIGSLAVVLNVLGLLARRCGDLRAAGASHLRAAALFGITGDYSSLQGALFNIAICRRDALALEGVPPDRVVLALVDMCRLVCSTFGVGADSAQAEIAGAEWALELGDFRLAQRYLKAAEALVEQLESSFDQAYFLLVRAKVELADPHGTSRPELDLRTAERLYTRIGDEESAAAARRVRESINPRH